MSQYEKAVAFWKKKNIKTEAELAEALNGHSIAFAYHTGKIEKEYTLTASNYLLNGGDGQIDCSPEYMYDHSFEYTKEVAPVI